MDQKILIAALEQITNEWVTADTTELPPPDQKDTYVYRLENADGEGPFKNRSDRDAWQLSGGDWVIPQDDLGFDWQIQDWLKENWMKGTAPEIRFAFKDQAQYEEYFTEDERERLSHRRFKLNKTPAAKVWEGDTQVFYIEDVS